MLYFCPTLMAAVTKFIRLQKKNDVTNNIMWAMNVGTDKLKQGKFFDLLQNYGSRSVEPGKCIKSLV